MTPPPSDGPAPAPTSIGGLPVTPAPAEPTATQPVEPTSEPATPTTQATSPTSPAGPPIEPSKIATATAIIAPPPSHTPSPAEPTPTQREPREWPEDPKPAPTPQWPESPKQPEPTTAPTSEAPVPEATQAPEPTDTATPAPTTTETPSVHPASFTSPRAAGAITGVTATYGTLGYPYAGTVWTERVDTLPDSAVDPNSPAMVAWLDGKVRNAPQAKTWWVNTNSYNGKTVLARPGTPRRRVDFGGDCGGRFEPTGWKTWASDVPVDPAWTGSNGTDSSLVIIDEERRQAYSFWIFKPTNAGTATACHGGRMNLTNNPAEAEGETPGVFPNRGGATASSLPHDAGSISRDDVDYARSHGYFPHALYLGLPDAKANVWSCPATRTDRSDSDPHAIMEGQRLRMKMTEQEITALPSQWQQWIARTGVIHGYLPADKTADTAIFSTIHDDAYWSSLASTMPGGLTIGDVPFATRLQVLKPNTSCTNAPTTRALGGTF